LGLFDEDQRGSFDLLQDFVIMVKTQFGKHVKIIRSDNGQEFYLGLYNNSISKEGFYIKQVA